MNQESWNNFIISNSSPSSFLQSWQWGEFQEALGNKIHRISLPSLSPGGRGQGEGGIVLQALVVLKNLPLGRTYLEIPKGPIAVESRISNLELQNEFIRKLKELGKKEKAVLARINPPIPSLPLSEGEIKRGWEGNFRKPEILLRQTEPEDTVLVDLSKTEDELLQNMHEKSRYNIRLAERKGVKVRLATEDKQAFEKFLELLDETSKRDGITYWPQERFWKFRERFVNSDFRMQNGEFPSSSLPRPGEARPPGLHPSEVGRGLRPARHWPEPQAMAGGERSNQGLSEELTPRAELLIGEYQNQVLAAAVIVFFGDTCNYLYAASSSENRNANVPSLVLWEAIKLAKSHGKRWYDMWGIAPAGSGENHPWAGITRFKTRYVKVGATGQEVRNVGARDLVLDDLYYNIFKLGKKFFKS